MNYIPQPQTEVFEAIDSFVFFDYQLTQPDPPILEDSVSEFQNSISIYKSESLDVFWECPPIVENKQFSDKALLKKRHFYRQNK